MNPSLRKSILQVHRWTGLTVGLLLIFLAVTGLTLVFRTQLEPVIYPDLQLVSCNTPMGLDALVARAQAAHPKVELDRIEMGGEHKATTLVRFADKTSLYLNPCSGDVLLQQQQWGGVFGRLEQLHRLRFLDADTSEFITGTTALVTALLLVLAGIAVWWPPSLRALKSALKVRTHLSGRAFELNLHRTVGFYASLVVFVATMTSLPMAFEWVRDTINVTTGSPAPAAKPKPMAPVAGAQMVAMGSLWQRAQALLKEPTKVVLQYARNPGKAVEIYVLERGAPHPNAYTYVYFDAYKGDVLRVDPYATSSLGNKIYRWAASVHMGYVGGLAGQLLLFFGILGVPVLGYTGVSSYLRRRFPAHADSQTLQVRVKKIRSEAQDIKSFELVSANGKRLPSFTPGAHISVKIDEGFVRQYSLCNNSSHNGHYRIAVKRVPDSRGGSKTMHECIGEGDVLFIGAPRNHFPLVPRAKHHLLLAGDIGITPLLCMVEHLQSVGASFSLHYFAPSIEHAAFHEELSQPEFRGKVDFHYAIDPERLHEYLHRLLWHRPKGAHLYLCGPRAFMDLVETVAETNWPPATIHVEYFNADPMAAAGPREAFEVELARSGRSLSVPAEKSIARVLNEEGVPVMTSCEQGVCGKCLASVLSGVPDHRDVYLSEAERKSCSKIMLCVSRAKTPRLVLDL